METLDDILSRVSESLQDAEHWPFPIVNGERTEASIRLIESKHKAKSAVDTFEDFEEAVW